MFSMYDVVNPRHKGMWIAAPNELEAKRFAIGKGHSKKIESLHAHDITDKALEGDGAADSLRKILESEKIGHLVKSVRPLTFQQVLAREHGDPGEWVVQE
jgi:hypothetical protein